MYSSKAKLSIGLMYLFALIGLLDATYLTIKHYSGEALNCSILDGCHLVTSSEYATIGPVSVALMGAIYYLFVLVVLVVVWQTKKDRIIRFISLFPIVGFLASLYFVYLQIFVIEALCLYCLISATSSTLLFISGLVLYHSLHRTYFIK